MEPELPGPERFEILRCLGEGVSATVYKARDRTTDSIVAVKVLKPHLQTDPVSLERFRREVSIVRALQHPQIVPIYDLVRSADVTYLVMEHIDGPNLADYVALRAPLAIDTVLSIVTQVLTVLSACHAQNVIHRDLKPQNVLVTDDTTVHLVDFGIAKVTAVSDLTQTGTAIGSPAYMAPELFARNTHDARTDLYALGVMTFELLTGTPPFRGDSLATLYQQHAAAPVPSVATARTDVPEWLQQFVRRLLAKAAYARYQSADEALVDIAQRRVLAHDSPRLHTVECVQCGEATLLDLPVCLRCGHQSTPAAGAGDYDLFCARDADDAALARFLDAVLAVREPLRRRRRSLLLAGVDGFTAELLTRSASRHDLHLTARPHAAWTELRKAIPLAFLALITGAVVQTVYRRVAIDYAFAFDETAVLQLFPFAIALMIGWLCLRRVRAVEVEPVIATGQHLARPGSSTAAWMQELLPSLTPARTDAMKGTVAHLIEQYLTVSRFGHASSDAVDPTLRQLVRTAAQLAHVVSEIERALAAPRFAERALRYAVLARDVPGGDAAAAGQCETLAGELSAYYAAEERYASLVNRLAQLQALFNRLVGRCVTLRTYLDEDLRTALTDHVRGLQRDLEVSRAVHADLERLR